MRNDEFAHRRETKAIASTAVPELKPRLILFANLVVEGNVPLMEPFNSVVREVRRRYKFEAVLRLGPVGLRKFREHDVAGQNQIGDSIPVSLTHSVYRVTTSATKAAASSRLRNNSG